MERLSNFEIARTQWVIQQIKWKLIIHVYSNVHLFHISLPSVDFVVAFLQSLKHFGRQQIESVVNSWGWSILLNLREQIEILTLKENLLQFHSTAQVVVNHRPAEVYTVIWAARNYLLRFCLSEKCQRLKILSSSLWPKSFCTLDE